MMRLHLATLWLLSCVLTISLAVREVESDAFRTAESSPPGASRAAESSPSGAPRYVQSELIRGDSEDRREAARNLKPVFQPSAYVDSSAIRYSQRRDSHSDRVTTFNDRVDTRIDRMDTRVDVRPLSGYHHPEVQPHFEEGQFVPKQYANSNDMRYKARAEMINPDSNDMRYRDREEILSALIEDEWSGGEGELLDGAPSYRHYSNIDRTKNAKEEEEEEGPGSINFSEVKEIKYSQPISRDIEPYEKNIDPFRNDAVEYGRDQSEDSEPQIRPQGRDIEPYNKQIEIPKREIEPYIDMQYWANQQIAQRRSDTERNNDEKKNEEVQSDGNSNGPRHTPRWYDMESDRLRKAAQMQNSTLMYKLSDELRNQTNPTYINFGVLVGGNKQDCADRNRQKLMNGFKDVVLKDIAGNSDMKQHTGIEMGLTILDECRTVGSDLLVGSFILLTNKPVNDTDHNNNDQRVLNVSREEETSQFTKALSKVGIRRFSTITSSDLYSGTNIMSSLTSKDIDTVIADVHGADLQLLVSILKKQSYTAQQFTWIFTSILSSDMLAAVEELLSKTKVISIFPVKNKKLLSATVKMEDNASQILAMQTALPYIHMLRQLKQSYIQAWSELCAGVRGVCPRLLALEPRHFIQKFFNPSIEKRRDAPRSYMLIVYKSSQAEDFVDVEIPHEEMSSTTMESFTLSSIIPTTSMTSSSTTAPTTTTTVTTTTATRTTTTTVTTTITTTTTTTPRITTTTTIISSTTETEQERTTAVTDIYTTFNDDYEEVTEGDLTDLMTPEPETEIRLDNCESFTACIIYVVQEEIEDSRRNLWIQNLVNRVNPPEHQAGLSVGNVLVGPSQLMDNPLPNNLVATVTLDSFEDYIHPDVHNFNINENVRSIPTEDVIVPVVSNLLGDLINNFGWDHVTLVYFHKGVAEQVAMSLLRSGKVCIGDIIHLEMSYAESPGFQRLAYQYAQDGPPVVIVGESPDQVSDLVNALAKETELRSYDHLAWSYLQTDGALAQMAEDMPDTRMYFLAEQDSSCDYCDDDQESTLKKGVSTVVHTVKQSLRDFSLQYCAPAKIPVMSCIEEFRLHLHESKKNSLSLNILSLNPSRLMDPESPLFSLAGEYKDRTLTLYQGHASSSGHPARDVICLNSTEDYSYKLLLRAHTSTNLETLWGSIAIGISIFGILIVIISGSYFMLTVSRKQKTEYGGSADNSRLLHYMLMLGLILLFSSTIPFLLRVSRVSCLLRASMPAVAFSIILSSLFVNLVATWRKSIYTVNPQAHQLCSPGAETPNSLLFSAVVIAFIQITITTVGLAVQPPTPELLDSSWRCNPGHNFEESMVLLNCWLLVLTVATLVMSVVSLKWCATNKDAKWSLVSVLSLAAVWGTWLGLVRMFDYSYRDPVCVMALVVSALVILLCIYARKLYEYSEFGKADNKLELMSNILLSESPTNSQFSTDQRTSTYPNILPGVMAMPEFEDGSILGESVYQRIGFEEGLAERGPIDMRMFDNTLPHNSLDEAISSGPGSGVGSSLEAEQIYHSISRGVSYKPMLKKIGSKRMLVLGNQHTLTHGSVSKI